MSSKLKILMCRPDFFDVKYIINPWMEGNIDKASIGRAKEQWQGLYDVISQRATVELIEPQKDWPDLVFTANAALVWNKRAIVSRFFHPERQGEEPFFADWFEKAGFEVFRLPDEMYFEGAGDALFDRELNCLWAAHGFRTKEESYQLISECVGIPVHTLKLVDSRFYHLDTCFCPLRGGKLLYFPGAFDEASQAKIVKHIAPEDRFAVSEEDAATFACNAVDLHDAIVFNKVSDSLTAKVKEWGFEPIQTPLTEFLKAGGAAKCLTLNLAG